MADIDLDKLIAQRSEARGDDGRRFTFSYKEQEWTSLDPMMLTDDEKDELDEVGELDVDIAAWYMGDEQFDRFAEAGGSSSIFFLALSAFMKTQKDEVEGKPIRPNRSSRRAASKRQKQH